MKTHVYLGSVLALAVSALAIPSRHARGYYEPDYCCPKIVPALGEEKHSVIEPIPGCSVHVSVVNDWGTCSISDKGFWWSVNWNDGTIDEGCTDYLGPFGPLTHKYTGCGDNYKACVTVRYCSSIDSTFNHCSHKANCCDEIKKCVVLY